MAAKQTKYEAVPPATVLYNLFFKRMKMSNDELARDMGIKPTDFVSMMRDEILFDAAADDKICKYVNLPEGTVLKAQDYYINFTKQRKLYA